MNKEKIILTSLPLFLFLLFWEYYSSLDSTNLFLFSSPSYVFNSLFENIKNGILINDFIITSIEVIVGFTIGNVLGSVLGMSLWLSPKVAKISHPYIITIGAIPIFSLAPMMIIWFGTDIFSKVMIVILSTIVIAITQSYEGAKNVDIQQINLLKSFGAKRIEIFFKIIIPSSLIWVFNSLRLSVSFAVLGAFIGEFISAEFGLGYRILRAGGIYDVSLVLASVLLLIALVFLMLITISYIEKIIMPWKKNI